MWLVGKDPTIRTGGLGVLTPGKDQSLAAGFRWLFAGSVATALSQWGSLAIIARVSTPAILSAYALALSVASVAFALGNLELRTLQVTDHSGSIPFASYFRLRWLTSLVALTGCVLFALVPAQGSVFAMAMLAVAVNRSVDSLSDILYGRLQIAGQLHRIGLSQLLRGAFTLVALPAALWAGVPPATALAAPALGSLAVFCLYDVPGIRKEGIRLCWRQPLIGDHLRELVRAGGPLTVVAALVAASAALPRLVSARDGDPGMAGVVTALTYLTVAPNLVMTSLGQAGMRKLAASAAAGNRRGYLGGVLRLAGLGAAVGAVVLAGGILAGPQLLQLFYGRRFAAHEQELLYFLSAGLLSYLNTGIGYSLSSARIFQAQVPMMAAVCLTSFVACSAWIPRYGIAGAASGWAAALALQLFWGSALVWQARPVTSTQREALSTL